MKTGESLSSSSPIRSSARSLGSEACPAVSTPQREGSTLRLSSSEEVNVKDINKLVKLQAQFAQAYYELRYPYSKNKFALSAQKKK